MIGKAFIILLASFASFSLYSMDVPLGTTVQPMLREQNVFESINDLIADFHDGRLKIEPVSHVLDRLVGLKMRKEWTAVHTEALQQIIEMQGAEILKKVSAFLNPESLAVARSSYNFDARVQNIKAGLLLFSQCVQHAIGSGVPVASYQSTYITPIEELNKMLKKFGFNPWSGTGFDDTLHG